MAAAVDETQQNLTYAVFSCKHTDGTSVVRLWLELPSLVNCLKICSFTCNSIYHEDNKTLNMIIHILFPKGKNMCDLFVSACGDDYALKKWTGFFNEEVHIVIPFSDKDKIYGVFKQMLSMEPALKDYMMTICDVFELNVGVFYTYKKVCDYMKLGLYDSDQFLRKLITQTFDMMKNGKECEITSDELFRLTEMVKPDDSFYVESLRVAEQLVENQDQTSMTPEDKETRLEMLLNIRLKLMQRGACDVELVAQMTNEFCGFPFGSNKISGNGVNDINDLFMQMARVLREENKK